MFLKHLTIFSNFMKLPLSPLLLLTYLFTTGLNLKSVATFCAENTCVTSKIREMDLMRFRSVVQYINCGKYKIQETYQLGTLNSSECFSKLFYYLLSVQLYQLKVSILNFFKTIQFFVIKKQAILKENGFFPNFFYIINIVALDIYIYLI